MFRRPFRPLHPPHRLPHIDTALATWWLSVLLATGISTVRAQTAIAWGDNQYGQCNTPGLPVGVTYQEIACGDMHSVARRSDGTVVAWGDNQFGQCTVPPLPSGLVFVEIAAGGHHTLARRSDGTLVAWGDNTDGQCNVPPLPMGLTFLEIAAGGQHSLARRSDGAVVAWGNNTTGQCNVPPLPPGFDCVEIAAGRSHCLARGGDGTVVAWGDNAQGQCDVPPLPPGATYDGLAAGSAHSLAHRSDGGVAAWGDNSMGQCDVQSLPPWMGYVDIAAGTEHSLLRQSDGFVLALGANAHGQCNPPVLPPGRTYYDVAAGAGHSLARYGPPRHATNTAIGVGCVARAQSFYEHFQSPAAAFDLADSTIRLTLNAAGYAVERIAGPPAFLLPTSPDLGLADNSLTAPIPLPFAIPYPGGSTNALVVGDNGCVFLQPSSDAGPFQGNVQDLLNGAPRHAAKWSDFAPASASGNGTVHVDIDAAQQVVHVSWLAMEEWGAHGALSTFQVALFGNGDVEYCYQACGLAGPALTGWSPGGGVPDPGSRDLSTSPPFATSASFALPLVQVATSLPQLGGQWQLETRQIPTAGVFGLQILGLSNANLELAAFGMPSCGLFAALDHCSLFVPAGPIHAHAVAIPDSQSLVGLHLYATALLWTTPALNAFGAITANGIDGRIGTP